MIGVGEGVEGFSAVKAMLLERLPRIEKLSKKCKEMSESKCPGCPECMGVVLTLISVIDLVDAFGSLLMKSQRALGDRKYDEGRSAMREIVAMLRGAADQFERDIIDVRRFEIGRAHV